MGAVAVPGAVTRPKPAIARPERARLIAFAALGLFGALTWAGLIEPARSGDLLLGLLVALAGGYVLITIPAGASPARRRATLTGVTLALLALALITAGVPLRMLWPKGWDELVAGMNQGISSTPGITVPYRGIDDWVRIAIVSGGTALLALAALLAFWPRKTGGFGHPIAAAVALGTLYAVPIIEHGPDHPYLGGTVFCILLAAFLWLERVRADQLAAGGVVVLLVAIASAVIAPRIDGTRPWFDYESFAEKLEPKKAEAFSWSHSYGPLRWPRDGREMLRIKTKSPTYWKAVNLDDFDGVRWRQGQPARDQLLGERINSKWVQKIQVVDRGLRSHEFVGAGVIQSINPGASRVPFPEADGTYVTATKPLQPGDTYQATVYFPRPTDAQLRRASKDYPAFTEDFLEMSAPVRGRSLNLVDRVTGRPLGPNALVRFAPYGDHSPPVVVWPSGFGVVPVGAQVLDDSPYGQLWKLTQQIKSQTHNAWEFVEQVQARVKLDTVYDESPPARAYPLASFLFDTKAGYCQQFSGVMALMLRMGGIPARVATGFSPGTYNSERKDWVIRDTDAHSWVEAYFKPYGWVTFDPTPAASPANSQLDDAGPGSTGGPAPVPNLGTLGQSGDRPFAPGDPGAALAPEDSGGGWELPVGLAVAALLLSIGGVVLWRRRVPFVALAPELAELQLALRRSGREPAPGVTLARLEKVIGGSDAAAAYVRAVRDQRFGYAAPGPTGAQRRALRGQLGAGLGVPGKLRAWWALPPAPRRALKSGLRALKTRLRRPYTQART
jgi:transglutaminase-like putative cysteine protease